MLGECQQKQVGLSPLLRNQETFLTLARTTAESSNELTATGILKGVYDEGFPGLRAAFFHPHI